MNEELLYNQLYEKTKDCGRAQFVRLLMDKERENKELKEQLQQKEAKEKELTNYLKEKIKKLHNDTFGLYSGVVYGKIESYKEILMILEKSDK